ncbi:MAG: hypothetical protein WC359_13685 [Dehalococcoidia bacterium]|jgi:hypothetical protein
MRPIILKPNSEGLVVSTAANDLVHTLGVNRSGVSRTAVIKKVLIYNNTGGNVTVQFGTLDLAAVPNFVAYLPTLLVLNGMDNAWTEAELPAVEFTPVDLALVNGRTGDIYLLASAAGIVVSVEIEEFGS